jgi:hypothetical protein
VGECARSGAGGTRAGECLCVRTSVPPAHTRALTCDLERVSACINACMRMHAGRRAYAPILDGLVERRRTHSRVKRHLRRPISNQCARTSAPAHRATLTRTHSFAKRARERERERERESVCKRAIECERGSENESERESKRESERARERERDRESERARERERERGSERERARARESESERERLSYRRQWAILSLHPLHRQNL